MHYSNPMNGQPLGIDFEVRFTDIFDLAEIQHMQELFSNATGVASIITHPDGTPITRPSNFCRLCQDIIRNTEKGCANCYQSDALLGRLNTVGPTIQRCLSGGLWDAGASITVGNKHIANWLIGQVRNEEVNDEIVLYALKIGADQQEFMKAYYEVPVMSQGQFTKVAEMLFAYAKNLSQNAYKNLQLKREMAGREKAYSLLQKNEELLFITLQSIADGVISTDKTGQVVAMNPMAEKLCGWKQADALGKDLMEVFTIVNSQTRKAVENPVSNVLTNGQIVGLPTHTVLISKQGTEFHITDSVAPICNEKGEINGVVLVFSDVTDNYLAQEKQRESDRSKSVLYSNLPGMAYRCKFDPEWTMEFISQGCIELTGYPASDLIENKNLSFNDIIHPDYRQHLWDVWQNAVKNRIKIGEEYKIITADHQTKWVWEQGNPIYDMDDKVVALEGLILDISGRKQIELALRENENYLKEAQAIAHLGTYTLDLTLNSWISSEVLDTIFGIEPDFDKSAGWISLIHPDWQKMLEDYFAIDIIENKKIFDKVYKIIRQNDKAERWVHGLGELIFNDQNQPTLLIGTIQDITEIKNTTETLRKSEALYRSILIASPDAIVVIDMDGTILMTSPAAKMLYDDKSNKELLGRNILDFLSAEDKIRAASNNTRMKDGNPLGTIEYQIVKANGNTFYADVNGDVIWSPEGEATGMVLIFRDVGERKRAEHALRISQGQLKNFASHLQNVREEERVILAREIHDELGQTLIAMKIDIGMLKQKILKDIKSNADEDILTKFDNILGLVNNTLHTTRKIMTGLRPELLYLLGFIEAVRFQASKFEERHKIRCIFDCAISKLELSSQHSVALFRIFQEAMANVAKHSQASAVNISLSIQNHTLIMIITDNGIGLNENHKNKYDSYGLIGMKERVFLLDGELFISGQTGKGTILRIEMPYNR